MELFKITYPETRGKIDESTNLLKDENGRDVTNVGAG